MATRDRKVQPAPHREYLKYVTLEGTQQRPALLGEVLARAMARVVQQEETLQEKLDYVFGSSCTSHLSTGQHEMK